MNAVKTVDASPPRTRGDRIFAAGILLLLFLALAFRIWAAWQVRIPRDPDGTAVHLMTRAIAQGETLLFFWGQAYLAPFEQMLGALCLRLGCPLLFAPPLATALFSFALFAVALRLIFLAGGRKMAFIGGLLLFAGPPDYAAFQVAPRGGYMSIILLSLLILLAGSRLACALSEKAGNARLLPLAGLLGLLAGLGIWQSFLVLPALAATGCGILLSLVRSRTPWRRLASLLAAGCLGVLAGGAPFWLYNATHAFASFDFSQNALSLPVRDRALFAWDNFVRLLSRKAAWGSLAAKATILASLAGAFFLWRNRAARPQRAGEILLEAALSLAFLGTFYLSSGFVATATARYLLPAVPLLAFALAALLARIPGGWALAVLLAVAQTASAIAGFRHAAAEGGHLVRAAASLESTAENARADAVYMPFRNFPLALHLPDGLPLVSSRKAFSPALRRACELARNPLYDKRDASFKEFLLQSGGEARPAGRLCADARPAWNHAAEIPPEDFSGPAELADGTTAGLSASADGTPVAFEWVFPEPRAIGFLFLGFSGASGRETVVIERDAGDGTWETVVPETGLARWAWSGPRAYPENADRAILALDGKPAARLRLSVGGTGWTLQEVRFLAPAGPAPDAPEELRAEEDAAWKTIAEEIRGGALFAGGRWAANRVAEARGDPHAIWGLDPAAWPESRRTGELPAGGRLVVAAEGAHAATVRRNWRGNGLEAESPAGDWTVFRGISPEGVFWDGTALLRVR